MSSIIRGDLAETGIVETNSLIILFNFISIKSAKMPAEIQATKVVVHPLVLLSVVDHFNRMGKIGNQKRVVGVLLGCWKAKGMLDVSNSFAGKKNF